MICRQACFARMNAAWLGRRPLRDMYCIIIGPINNAKVTQLRALQCTLPTQKSRGQIAVTSDDRRDIGLFGYIQWTRAFTCTSSVLRRRNGRQLRASCSLQFYPSATDRRYAHVLFFLTVGGLFQWDNKITVAWPFIISLCARTRID